MQLLTYLAFPFLCFLAYFCSCSCFGRPLGGTVAGKERRGLIWLWHCPIFANHVTIDTTRFLVEMKNININQDAVKSTTVTIIMWHNAPLSHSAVKKNGKIYSFQNKIIIYWKKKRLLFPANDSSARGLVPCLRAPHQELKCSKPNCQSWTWSIHSPFPRLNPHRHRYWRPNKEPFDLFVLPRGDFEQKLTLNTINGLLKKTKKAKKKKQSKTLGLI